MPPPPGLRHGILENTSRLIRDRFRILGDVTTFTAAGMRLLKRMVLVIDDGIIVKVFYPVFPPDKSADEVIAWLLASR